MSRDVGHRRVATFVVVKVFVGKRRRTRAASASAAESKELAAVTAAAAPPDSSSSPPSGADPDVRRDPVRLHARLPDLGGRERRGLAEVDGGGDGADVARAASDEADVVLGEDPFVFYGDVFDLGNAVSKERWRRKRE